MGIFDRLTNKTPPAIDLFRTHVAEAWLQNGLAEFPEVIAATSAGESPRVLLSDLRLVPHVRKAFGRVWIELLATDEYADRLAQANARPFQPSALRDGFTADACAPERLLLIPGDPLLEAARKMCPSVLDFNGANLLSGLLGNLLATRARTHLFLTQLFADWSFTVTPAGVSPDGRLVAPVVNRDPPAQLVESATIFDWGISSYGTGTGDVERQVSVEAAAEADMPVLLKRERYLTSEQSNRLVVLCAELIHLYESKKETVWATIGRHLKEQPRGYDLILVSSYACAPNLPDDGAPDNLVGKRSSQIAVTNKGAVTTPDLAAALSARTLKHGVLAQYDHVSISVDRKAKHNTRAREWGIDP